MCLRLSKSTTRAQVGLVPRCSNKFLSVPLALSKQFWGGCQLAVQGSKRAIQIDLNSPPKGRYNSFCQDIHLCDYACPTRLRAHTSSIFVLRRFLLPHSFHSINADLILIAPMAVCRSSISHFLFVLVWEVKMLNSSNISIYSTTQLFLPSAPLHQSNRPPSA